MTTMMAQQEAPVIAIEMSHMGEHELEKDFGPRLWWQLGYIERGRGVYTSLPALSVRYATERIHSIGFDSLDKQHVPICSSSSTSRPRAHSCWGWKAAFALDLRSPHVSIIKSVVLECPDQSCCYFLLAHYF